jgi:hypothetical protein
MDVDIEKITKELEDFFEIEAPDFDIVLINTREDYDAIHGKKTEPWQAATVKGNTIYAIHPDKLEEITVHKKESHPKRIKHELSHVFYDKCTGGEIRPAWLNEGLAYYLADQGRWTLNEYGKLMAVDYFSRFDNKVYGGGEYMVRTLIEKYGKKKLLVMIKKITPPLTEEKFGDIFKDVYGFDFTKEELKKIIE